MSRHIILREKCHVCGRDIIVSRGYFVPHKTDAGLCPGSNKPAPSTEGEESQ